MSDDADHGTYAAYQRHRRDNETPCDNCREAANDYHRTWRNTPKGRTQARTTNTARGRALTKLAQLHPHDYRQLYADELAQLRESHTP